MGECVPARGSLWPACRSVEEYERLNFIDEGSYGRVFRARERSTGKIYALKKMKDAGGRDGFPASALRELMALFAVQHPNIVALKEVVVGSTLNAVYLVLEYAAQDLQSALSKQLRPFATSEAKSLLQQLLRGIAHLHSRALLHRDLKPANLLLAAGGLLKICDFGLTRRMPADTPGANVTGSEGARLTPGVATLWYRAPELLLADPMYGSAVDVWAAGCVFAEILTQKPLFPGNGELDQISRICNLLGRPDKAKWPGLASLPNASRIVFPGPSQSGLREHMAQKVGLTVAGCDLLEKMLTYDPKKRISAEDALQHEYFSEPPFAKDPALIQTFPDDRRG